MPYGALPVTWNIFLSDVVKMFTTIQQLLAWYRPGDLCLKLHSAVVDYQQLVGGLESNDPSFLCVVRAVSSSPMQKLCNLHRATVNSICLRTPIFDERALRKIAQRCTSLPKAHSMEIRT
jgi:hypothetical protein